MILGLDKFEYSAPTAGVNSRVLKYEMPLNAYVVVDNSKLMGLKITAKEDFTYTAATTGSVTVTLGANVALVGNLYSGTPDYSLSVLAYWASADSGVNPKRVAVTAVSGKSVTVNVDDASNTSGGTLTIYYTPAQGTYSWVVTAPTAASTISATLTTDTLSHVNMLDQASPETGLYFPKKTLLTEHFTLELWSLAPVVISMDPASASTAEPNTLADVSLPVEMGDMDFLLSRDPNVRKTAVELLQQGI